MTADHDLLIRVDQRLNDLVARLERREDDFVTQAEFWPVKCWSTAAPAFTAMVGAVILYGEVRDSHRLFVSLLPMEIVYSLVPFITSGILQGVKVLAGLYSSQNGPAERMWLRTLLVMFSFFGIVASSILNGRRSIRMRSRMT
jgi:hypothetical protein